MTTFIKENEKVMMVMLLVVIAPTFAFTSFATMFRGGDPVAMQIEGNGEPFTKADIIRARQEIRNNTFYQVVSYYGPRTLPDGSINGMLSAISPANDQVYDYMLTLRYAESKGIVASEAEIHKAVKDVAKPLLAMYDVWKEASEDKDSNVDPISVEELRDKCQQLGEVPFQNAKLSAALADAKFSFGTTVRDFQDGIRNMLTFQKVRRVAARPPIITDKEVFDLYLERNKQRGFKLVRIPTSIVDDGTKEVSDADRQKAYNKHRREFMLPKRIAIEIARLSEAPAVSEDDARAKYEAEKTSLYVRSFDEEHNPTEFTPFEDVREKIELSLQQAKAYEMLTSALIKARGSLGSETKTDPTADFDWQAQFPDGVGVEIVKTEPFGIGKLDALNAKVKGAGSAFGSVWRDWAAVEAGQLCGEAVKPQGDSPFIYRIIEKLDDKQLTLDEVDEQQAIKIDELALRTKLIGLARAKAEAMKAKLEKGGDGITIESVAAEENLTVHEIAPMPQKDAIKIDGKPIGMANQQVRAAAFSIRELNGYAIAEYDHPVTPELREAFLIQYTASAETEVDVADWTRQQTMLRNLLTRERGENGWVNFVNALRAKAHWANGNPLQLRALPKSGFDPRQMMR